MTSERRPTRGSSVPFAFLLSRKEAIGEAVKCVFAVKHDADKAATTLNARGIGRYPGWTSQREFRFDRATEDIIAAALAERKATQD